MWVPDLRNRHPVRYLAIVEALAEAIARGALRPGDRLPTHRELAWRLGVNVSTVTRAYVEATRRHLISGEVGRGTFVLSESREAMLFGLDSPAAAPAAGTIDLSVNIPASPGDTADAAEIEATLADLAARQRLGGTLGHPSAALIARARIAGATWLAARGLDIRPGDVIPTAGAQQALLAVLLALCRPGDPVLVEDLTFPGIKALARQLALPLHGVATDGEGILPEALDRAARATSARVVVLVPTLQNPTGATMGAARQQAVAEIARQRGLQVIEDDVYGMLAETPPLARLLPETCTVVTSLSKCVAGGLRFGVIAGTSAAVRAVAAEPQTTLWPLAPLMVEIACRWLEDGTALRRVRWQREEIAARYRLARRALSGRPEGGPRPSPHAWLTLPTEDPDPAALCRRAGLEVVPAATFAVTREPPQRIRVSLTAAASRADLSRALDRLHRLGAAWSR